MVHEMIDGTYRQTNLPNESPEYLAKREEVRQAEIELMRQRERVAELRRALKTFLAELGRGGGTRFDTQAAEVLRGIERGASHQADNIGDGSRDYLALVGRILREHPPEPVVASPIIRP